MPRLIDWTQLDEEALKHHSGTAVYHKTFGAPRPVHDAQRTYVRIEGLEATSRIWINGQEAGYVWCAPWEVDITPYLNEGENTLRIEVANQLTNRMIGDLALPETERTTWGTSPLVKPGDSLLPAGITRSVKLVVR